MSEYAKPALTFENASSSTSSEYFFAPLVFASSTRHGIVLFDLKRNRYLGLEGSDALILSRFVRSLPQREEWRDAKSAKPARHGVVLLDVKGNRYLGSENTDAPADSNSESASDQSIADNLLQSMLKEGLVTRDLAAEPGLVSTEIDLMCALVSIGDEITLVPRVRMRDIATFAFFLSMAAIALKCLPLSWLVRRAHDRRNKAYLKGYKLNLDEVSRHVCMFRAIRPNFFVAKDNRLLHALALINYLAHYGEYPAWVFGVATEPWATNTWLQHENYLLDGNPEAVVRLEPILAV